MSIYMGTTKISAARTAGEIQEKLAASGAEAVQIEYDTAREAAALGFRITRAGTPLHYRLPVRWRAVHALMQRDKAGKRNSRIKIDEAQSKRVAWRQILRWVEAQLALIDTNIVELPEVFLPYMQVDAEGTTFYQHAITTGHLPALPAPKGK